MGSIPGRWKTLIALGLALAFGWVLRGAIVPVGPPTIHISGDGRDQVARALYAGPGPFAAPTPDTATTQVILLRRWQNFEALPHLARLCGAACAARPPAIQISRPALNGLSRIVIVDLSAMEAGPALDTDQPIPETALNCILGLILRQHRTTPPRISKCPVVSAEVVRRPRLWTPRPQRRLPDL